MKPHASTDVRSSCIDAMLSLISMRNGIRRSSFEIHTRTPPCHFRPPGASAISNPSPEIVCLFIVNVARAIGRNTTLYGFPSEKIVVVNPELISVACWRS